MGAGFMGKAHTQAYRSIPVYIEDIRPKLIAICSRSLKKVVKKSAKSEACLTITMQ